jgi:F-type H+-transporting ATPase subunit 8
MCFITRKCRTSTRMVDISIYIQLTLVWIIIGVHEGTNLIEFKVYPFLESKIKMPQLIPFFFINQLVFSFLTLLALIVVFSKYILPLYFSLQVIRMYLISLS